MSTTTVPVALPRLGESVTEGTVTRWLKQPGDRVETDEPLVEVSTDKVDTEIPSPASGVLLSIDVHEDETVDVGTVLATIGDSAGDDTGAPDDRRAIPGQDSKKPSPADAGGRPAPGVTPLVRRLAAASGLPVEAVTGTGVHGRVLARDVRRAVAARAAAPGVTPLVRRTAAELDVDLTQVQGTGVGGRIRRRDVVAAAPPSRPATTPAPPVPAQPSAVPPVEPALSGQPGDIADIAARPGRTEPMGRLRKVIAERMIQSLQTSAQLTTVVEVDVTRIARLRRQVRPVFEQREGVPLSFLPFFAVATIEALKRYPVLNASVDTAAGTITYHDSVHLGIAVDTERGLLVPVIADAADLNLAGLARRIAHLAQRTRANTVSPDELGGATFTVTNTGSRGALFDTPIIAQPQVGILGTGAVVKRPVVIDDPRLGEVVAVRSMVHLALTYDHRIVDGADAARFLGTVKQRLEAGDFAAELGSVR